MPNRKPQRNAGREAANTRIASGTPTVEDLLHATETNEATIIDMVIRHHASGLTFRIVNTDPDDPNALPLVELISSPGVPGTTH